MNSMNEGGVSLGDDENGFSGGGFSMDMNFDMFRKLK